MNFNTLLEELLLELSGTEIYQKYYSKIPYETFVEIVMADPKSNMDGVGNLQSLGKYAKLLLSFYQKGTLQIEDLIKAKEYLGYVYQHRVSLEINSLRSLADLYKVVQKYIIEDTLDFKEIINALTIDVDYKLLHEGKDWSFYQPLTEKGASYLGFSTEWCTTWGQYCLNKKNRDRDNYFERHHKQGPLFIIINNINPIDKYQFHFETSQYMDKMDRRINLPDFWFSKDEVKFYFFPSLVRETSKEEVESEVKRISILPDEDGMTIIRKSIGVINNPLVEAILKNDEDKLEDLIIDDNRNGDVYINQGRLIIQVDELRGDAEGVDRSIDQYRIEGNNGWEFVHSDIENKYYEQEDYELDIEGIFTNYYNNNKSELSKDLGVESYEQFKGDYFGNYVNDEYLKDSYIDDVTELSYGSYQQENDKEADLIEKYLSFGSRSDELNFSVVFFVQFLIKKGITRIDYNSDNDNGLTLQDVTDMYISNYGLTVEIEEPVYGFEITYPKYGGNNYITKRTDEYFDKLISDPENNKNCIELRKKLNNIINKFFNGGYGTDTFNNEHVRVQLKSQHIDCNTESIKIDYENKDNKQNFYNKSVKIDNLVSYLTNYQLNLNESKLNLTSLISK